MAVLLYNPPNEITTRLYWKMRNKWRPGDQVTIELRCDHQIHWDPGPDPEIKVTFSDNPEKFKQSPHPSRARLHCEFHGFIVSCEH